MNRQYAHMCRDGHGQIGHNDSSSELCPLCLALERIADLEADAREHQALIDLQHTRTIEADRLWQAAHETDVWPDLGEMIRWLMERADKAEAKERGCPHCGGWRLEFRKTNSQWEDDSIVCLDCKFLAEHDIVAEKDMEFQRLKRLLGVAQVRDHRNREQRVIEAAREWKSANERMNQASEDDAVDPGVDFGGCIDAVREAQERLIAAIDALGKEQG